jgi:thioredoxin 2
MDREHMTKVTCIHCAATNNYPEGAQNKKVVCGRCKTELPKPGQVIEPLSSQIETVLNGSSLPLLVDFYSPTCAPCQMMNPVLENLALRRAGELTIVKINIDDYPQMASIFGVQGVPTFVIVHRGNERDRVSGAMSEADFSLWVASRI